MFNKRWKKILVCTLSVIIVLGVAGLFAANYAVDKLMNSMVDSFDLESEPSDTATGGDVVPVESAAPTTSNTEVVGGSNGTEGGLGKGDTAGDTATSATSKPTEVKPSDQSGDSTDGYSGQVSIDKAKDIKENVTIKEKADVASIIMGQLSVSDINRLKDLASGGLTIDEKREARSIILGKVSEEQYNELSQIAKKYGVSQGRTYDQITGKEKGSE